MIIRAATLEELRSFSTDPLHLSSVERYVVEKDGKPAAYFGVSTASLVGLQGWPWVFLIRKDLLTKREIAVYAKAALQVWSSEYSELRAAAEKGQYEGWFRFLGFVVDTESKPFYAEGKTMVHMRYAHGRPDAHH